MSSSCISLRRALRSSYRRFSLLNRPSTSSSTSTTTLLKSSHLSHSTTASAYFRRPSVHHFSPALNFITESRRGYAKGKRQAYNDSDDGEEEEEDDNKASSSNTVDIAASAKAATASQMEAAIDALSRELLKLRTGRASAGMLDHIIVESAGVKSSLNRMAVVSVIDPKTLSITPFDPSNIVERRIDMYNFLGGDDLFQTLKELEKAIVSSPLGLNPRSDNQRLIASIPPLTKEHMQAVCKVVAKSSEDAKQSIRRARQKALDTIKKALPKKTKDDSRKKGKDKETPESKKRGKDKTGQSFSEDDAKRLEKEIDELTKKYIKSAEDMCKAKEKEVTAG